MTPSRFQQLTGRYSALRVAVIGDFCLDRYLDIDPSLQETSIETGRPVHNVTDVRCRPGGAGTIVANLSALGIQSFPVGFAGDDGEGFELVRALSGLPGVDLKYFLKTPDRRTFTYAKPLLHVKGKPAEELDRLDSKNWTPTPASVEAVMMDSAEEAMSESDAVILLEQTDLPNTGVLTSNLLARIGGWVSDHSQMTMLADSRRGLQGYPPVSLKMNVHELAKMGGMTMPLDRNEVDARAISMAVECKKPVFITLAEEGMIGAAPDGMVTHVPARPLHGPIDVVGAGDAVTASLCASLAARGNVLESLELATLAASIVLHKVGSTGTASIKEMAVEMNGE